MSKHKLRGRGMLVAAGVAVVVLAAAPVSASPVRFDNLPGPGHFDWRPQVVGEYIYLDIMADAASQTGASGDGTYRQYASTTTMGTHVRRGGSSGEGVEFVYADDPAGNKFLVPVGYGDEIPSPVVPGMCDGFGSVGAVYVGNVDPPWPNSPFTLGEEAYIGVTFFDPGGSGLMNYGWIGVLPEWRTFDYGGGPTDVFVLEAFAWGYETEVGVPIEAGIPEPGTLALLALGAAAVAGRRRRA